MAREMLLSCDTCGRKHGGRIVVISTESRDSDGDRWMVDLCRSCNEEMKKAYGWHPLHRTQRKGFTVYDSPSDIPKNATRMP